MPGWRSVTAGVWLLHGSAHDAAEVAGATHLVEHLTLRRCGDHDRRSLALLVDRLGGEVDAWTSPELLGVTINTTVDALGDALALLADAVGRPTFDPEDVDLERRVTLAELELVQDDPAEQVEDALLAAAWGDHPLARPVIGARETVSRLTPRRLRAHHRHLLQPGGMVAAVVGDVSPRMVAEGLAGLPLHHRPSHRDLPELKWRGRSQTLRRAGLDQVHARIAVPAVATGDPAVPAASLLNRVLGVGAASRLFQRLRESEGLTYDIWSSLVLRRSGGILEVGWACSPDVFDDTWRLVGEELERLPRDLEPEELEVAREGLLRTLEMDAETPSGTCALEISELLERNRRFDLEVVRSELERVSLDDVCRLGARCLGTGQPASAVCAPEDLAVRVA